MCMAVDLALDWTKRRGIGIVNQQKFHLVDVQPIDDILERFPIPFIAMRIVIALDEKVDKLADQEY